MSNTHQMPSIAIVGAPQKLEERLREELQQHFEIVSWSPGFVGICILASNWASDEAIGAGGARLALVCDVYSEEITHALASGDLHGVAEKDFAKGQLRVACTRAWDRFQSLTETGDQHLKQMVESMADGLLMTELGREQVLTNPAARSLLNIDSETNVTQRYLKERLGFYPFDLVSADDGKKELLREELIVDNRRLHSMVSPVRSPSGTLIGVVVVLRDFTEAHALAHRQQEFFAMISHELRTPLTSITGALDIALSEYAGQLNDKQQQYIGLARDSCTSLHRIVDDLLDVARAENGCISLRLAPVDLRTLTTLAVEKYRSAAAKKGVDLQFRYDDTDRVLERFRGDANRLTQVLNNLLSNALKFTPYAGRIEVEMFGSSSRLGVSVFNNGESIAVDARERIFESFEQADTNRRRVGGTGLGLAICRSIIEAHGGHIWVEPFERGAKFVFTLPGAGPEERSNERVNTPPPDRLLGQQRSQRSSVLLVDSDKHSRYILKSILMSAGYQVSVASSPDAALEQARSCLPPLIIVHARASLPDPTALLQILEHDADTRKSALLALSASESDLLTGAPQASAVSHMSFPVVPDAFVRTCDSLIQGASTAHNSRVLVVEDDAAIRLICAEVLRHAGMTVREAANGRLALEEAQQFRPDLVLLDIMMPDLDGFQTAERLKADPASALTPIIFLSARGETSDQVEAFRIGAEDYIVKPFVAAELVARVRKALLRSNRELEASPTTQLPGGGAIEAEISERLSDVEAAFCYLDLDNLKAYNDYYSYAKADSIIRQTGDLIRSVIRDHGDANDFIGHIAGDDFVFITTRDKVDEVCKTLCLGFDRLVPLYYDRADRTAGFIETQDRYNETRRFPLMTVSIAAVTTSGHTSGREAPSYSSLAAAASQGKKQAKAITGSSYVRDGTPTSLLR